MRLMVLTNNFKKGDKEPDSFPYIGAKEKADNNKGKEKPKQDGFGF